MQTNILKTELTRDPEKFDELRKQFPERRAFSAIQIKDAIVSEADRHLLQSWGMKIK